MGAESSAVRYEIRDDIAILRLSRGRGNAINGELLDGLMRAAGRAEEDAAVRGVLLAADGKLFCPGLDLVELSTYDRAALDRFLHRFTACLLQLYVLPKPTLAAIHGHAVAGGTVLTLTADRRVLAEGAIVGLNELKVGVPLPFGVSMMLRDAVPESRLEEIALFGRNYRGVEALAAGLVHDVVPSDGFEDACLERLAEMTSKDAAAFAVTKRYLRSATVERIRAYDAQFIPEWLDCWFSDGTQRRVAEIVAGLTAKDR